MPIAAEQAERAQGRVAGCVVGCGGMPHLLLHLLPHLLLHLLLRCSVAPLLLLRRRRRRRLLLRLRRRRLLLRRRRRRLLLLHRLRRHLFHPALKRRLTLPPLGGRLVGLASGKGQRGFRGGLVRPKAKVGDSSHAPLRTKSLGSCLLCDTHVSTPTLLRALQRIAAQLHPPAKLVPLTGQLEVSPRHDCLHSSQARQVHAVAATGTASVDRLQHASHHALHLGMKWQRRHNHLASRMNLHLGEIQIEIEMGRARRVRGGRLPGGRDGRLGCCGAGRGRVCGALRSPWGRAHGGLWGRV